MSISTRVAPYAQMAEDSAEHRQDEPGPAGDDVGHGLQDLPMPVHHGVGEHADEQDVTAHQEAEAGVEQHGVGRDQRDFPVAPQSVPEPGEAVRQRLLFRAGETRVPDVEQDGQQDDREEKGQHDAGGGHEAEHLHRQQFGTRERQHAGRGRQGGDQQRQTGAAVGPGQGAVMLLALAAVGEIGVHHVDAVGDAHREHQQHRQRDEGRNGNAEPYRHAQVQATLRAMVRMGQSTALKERNRIHSSIMKISTISVPSTANWSSTPSMKPMVGGVPTG